MAWGSDPGVYAICGFEFVFGSLLCSERFFSRHPVFPSSQKLIFPNSNSARSQVDEEPLVKVLPLNHYLFIYLFILYINFTDKYNKEPISC